jgi:Lrp/AsnC family leucine-responsive transcriptional regulator
VHRLEDTGVILGYQAQVDSAKIGLPVRAFVKVTVAGDKLFQFASAASRIPEVLECHRVTGAESYIVQIAVEDAAHIEQVIDAMMPYVATNTSLVLASPVRSRALVPPAVTKTVTGKSANNGQSNFSNRRRRHS